MNITSADCHEIHISKHLLKRCNVIKLFAMCVRAARGFWPKHSNCFCFSFLFSVADSAYKLNCAWAEFGSFMRCISYAQALPHLHIQGKERRGGDGGAAGADGCMVAIACIE